MDKDSILRAALQAAEQMDGNPPQPAIPIQPVPTAVQIASAKGPNGDSFVVMTVLTPVGQNIYFFDSETAEKLSEALSQTARLARTGLEIAR